MPKTIEEMSQELKTFQEEMKSNLEKQRKDFEIKLESTSKDVQHYKEIAQTNADDLKKAQEKLAFAEAEKTRAFAEAKKAELAVFFDSAVKSGKLTPAQKEIAIKLAESMTSETVIATFAQADGSTSSHTQLSLFKAFVTQLAKLSVFRERTTTETPGKKAVPAGDGEEVLFSEEVIFGGDRKVLPLQDHDLHARAVAFQDEERTAGRAVSYETALIHISMSDKRSGK